MAGHDPATRDDVELLLRYAQVTHSATTDIRRRISAVFLAIAMLFGALALWSGGEWITTRAAVEAVTDESLVEAMGVRIPDPRPALERSQLRLRAFFWGVIAAGATILALLALVVFALLRPTPLPPELRALERPEQALRTKP